MNVDEKTIPFEVNLVQYDRPEVMINQSALDKHFTVKKSHSLESGDDFDFEATYDLGCNEILSRILPPREWKENGQFWTQKLSNQPATKSDVIRLGEKLDKYLEQFKAKEAGMCPIKQELYAQCFNEIIRQVTLNCSERGCMLMQVRDEINMTIDAYQKLTESSVAYGIRKTLMQEHKEAELEEEAEKLRFANKTVKDELAEAAVAIEEIERSWNDERKAEMGRHAEKIMVLKKSNQIIKSQLESIIVPKKVAS